MAVTVKLVRNEYLSERTFGDFYVVDSACRETRICLSLEDTVRKNAEGAGKIPGRTAIPAGTYRLQLDWSTRFKKVMLHALDVPNFDGVRVHGGITELDTEGCPLTGTTKNEERVFDSQAALAKLLLATLTAFVYDPERKMYLTVIDTKEPIA